MRAGDSEPNKEAVEEAVCPWEERERLRAEFLVKLKDARSSLSEGVGRLIPHPNPCVNSQEKFRSADEPRLVAEMTSGREWAAGCAGRDILRCACR
jgi:hypothetical protein